MQAPKKAAAGSKKSGGKKGGAKANPLFVAEPRSFRVGGAIRVRALALPGWLLRDLIDCRSVDCVVGGGGKGERGAGGALLASCGG